MTLQMKNCSLSFFTKMFCHFCCFFSLLTSLHAFALGLNAENFTPTAGNSSALLNETPHVVPNKVWMYGLTLDYAYRPAELGDGKKTRVSVIDHLLMSHFSAGYGLMRDLDVYGVIPVALWDSHSNPDKYLLEVGASRSAFLLSDPRIGLKYRALEWGTRFAGTHSFAADFRIPFGQKQAMLSDGTTRAKVSLPSSLFSTEGDWELGLTPGIIFWGDRDRLIGETGFVNGRKVLLARSWAASWDSSFRWSPFKTQKDKRNLSFEAGLKTEFTQGYISLSSVGNPWEWGFGARYVADEKMTLHASVGSGLGRGVGAPLARLMAGIRYNTDGYQEIQVEDAYDPRDALPVYTDVDLDRILAESRAEEAPRQLANDESLLRLLVNGEVIDIGFVRFKFNSAELTPAALQTIERLKERLVSEQLTSIHIEGHTDSVGSLGYNMALSKRRADSVKRALIDRDIQPEIISTSGVAFRFPIASNATKQGRAANRRIEVSLNGSKFRRANPTPQELSKYREWIAPGGKKPLRD